MSEFDPYQTWLGIPASDRPLDHYTVLGLERFEDDQDVITSGAELQISHLRNIEAGQRGALAEKLLDQLSLAQRTLRNPEKKAKYDALLRQKISKPEPAAPAFPVVAPVGEVDLNALPPVGSEPSQAKPKSSGRNSRDRRRRERSQKPKRKSKSGSGALWTVLGGLGGGVCAVIVSYFILTGMGIWDADELKSHVGLKGSESKSTEPKGEDPKELPSEKPPISKPAKTKPDTSALSEDGADDSDGPSELSQPNLDSDPTEGISAAPQPVGTSLAAVAASLIPKPEESAGQLLPSKAELDEIEDAFDAFYETKFKEAKKSINDTHELAKKLLRDGMALAGKKPAEMYVLLDRSVDLAKRAGDGDTAAKALLNLQSQFEISNWDQIHTALDTISRRVKSNPQAESFYKAANRVARSAISQREFSEAEFIYIKALSIAKSQDNSASMEYFTDLRDYFRQLKGWGKRNAEALESLETHPDDPDANQDRGDYLIFIEGDTTGFGHWAKAAEASRKAIAEQESKLAAGPTGQLRFEAGKAWFEFSEDNQAFAEKFALLRSQQLLKSAADLDSIRRGVSKQMIAKIQQRSGPIFIEQDSPAAISPAATADEFPTSLTMRERYYFAPVGAATIKEYPKGLGMRFSPDNRVAVAASKGIRSRNPFESKGGYVLIDGRPRGFAISVNTTVNPAVATVERYDNAGNLTGQYTFVAGPVPEEKWPKGFFKMQ